MAKGQSSSMKDSYAIGDDIGAAGQPFALAKTWREVFKVFLLEAFEMVKEIALPHFSRGFKDFPPDNLPVSVVIPNWSCI
jgi:hypothetical protein